MQTILDKLENIDKNYNFDYSIVTCFFDVRSKENNPHVDSQDRGYVLPDGYFNACNLLFEKEFPLIIYTEPKYAAKMWKLRPIHLHHRTFLSYFLHY